MKSFLLHHFFAAFGTELGGEGHLVAAVGAEFDVVVKEGGGDGSIVDGGLGDGQSAVVKLRLVDEPPDLGDQHGPEEE